jgi:hypothetical protein
MIDPALVLKVGLAAVFLGWALVIAHGILAGSINTTDLLRDGKDGELSPARIQLLIVTIVTLAMYVSKVVAMKRGDHSLPDIDPTVLAVLGGSHAVHLGSKGYGVFFGSSDNAG